MNNNKLKRILLVGIGNDLRGDDALGYYLIKNFNLKILKNKFKKNKNLIINKLIVRYLDYDIAEKLIKYDIIIFADASINTKSVLVYKINIDKVNNNNHFSHHLNIENILLYTMKFYNKVPDSFVVCIGGYNFEYIQKISDLAKSNLKLANKILYKLINFFIMKYSNQCKRDL